jgi:pyruvate-formate lyase
MQAQVNVLDPSFLIEARDHPDRHPKLLVRVSGYSAYFNNLSPAMKEEIIRRGLIQVGSVRASFFAPHDSRTTSSVGR